MVEIINLTPKQMNLRGVNWIVDPLADDHIKEMMGKSSSFAESLMKNKTQLFFEYLNHKPINREPVVVEVKGQVRSGKSTLSTGICKYVSKINEVPFPLTHISPNEIMYLEKLRTFNAPDGSCWQIDEQSLEINQKVMTYNGLIKLKDLEEGKKINVLSMNMSSLKTEYKSATKVRNKIKQTFRVKTESGRVIEATDNHIFFVIEGGIIKERQLKDLKNGDELVTI